MFEVLSFLKWEFESKYKMLPVSTNVVRGHRQNVFFFYIYVHGRALSALPDDLILLADSEDDLP